MNQKEVISIIKDININLNNLANAEQFTEAYNYLLKLKENKEYINNRDIYLLIEKRIFDLSTIENQTIVPLKIEAEEFLAHFNDKDYIFETKEIEFILNVSFLLLFRSPKIAKLFINKGYQGYKDLGEMNNEKLNFLLASANAEYYYKIEDYNNSSKYFLQMTNDFSDVEYITLINKVTTRIKLFDSLTKAKKENKVNKTQVLLDASNLIINNGINNKIEFNITHHLLDRIEYCNDITLKAVRTSLIELELNFRKNNNKSTLVSNVSKQINKPTFNTILRDMALMLEQDKGNSDRVEEYLGDYKEQAEKNHDDFFLVDILYAMTILYKNTNNQDYLIASCLELMKILKHPKVLESKQVKMLYLEISESLIINKQLLEGKECLDIAFELNTRDSNDNKTFLPGYFQKLGLYNSHIKKINLSKDYYKKSGKLYYMLGTDNNYLLSAISYLSFIDLEFSEATLNIENIKTELDILYEILSEKITITKQKLRIYAKAQAIFKTLGDTDKFNYLNSKLKAFYE